MIKTMEFNLDEEILHAIADVAYYEFCHERSMVSASSDPVPPELVIRAKRSAALLQLNGELIKLKTEWFPIKTYDVVDPSEPVGI